MTYEEAREFIIESNQYGSILGLKTITELLNRLDNPQDKLRTIHVAGTNGKGSTSAFISSVLSCAGYKVGRYLSPSVFSYREIVQISNINHADIIASEYITKAGICKAIEAIKSACEEMVRDGFAHPTSFEIETAMAFLYFYEERVDFAIIEVGMGGRLDATNVLHKPVGCIITSISMDHMQFLGDTLEEIATEKAGIIKKGAFVISQNKAPEVLKVLEKSCKHTGTQLVLADPEQVTVKSLTPEGTTFIYQDQEYKIRLLGKHQIGNALNAINTAAELGQLGYQISKHAIIQGLFFTSWRGRFDVIAREPYFVIDGAHNEDAARQLKKAVEAYFLDRRVIGIMGVFADKEYEKILSIMAPVLNTLITLTPNNSRALLSFKLAKEAERSGIDIVVDANTVHNAITFAYQKAEKEDVIIAFGSLSYLGELYKEITWWEHPNQEDERC